MTTNELVAIAYLLTIGARMLRIVERWKSPFLCGSGWFFAFQVQPTS